MFKSRTVVLLFCSLICVGCGDDRVRQLRQAGFTTQNLIEIPCSDHQKDPKHLCPRTLAELASQQGFKPAGDFDAVCLGLVSEKGRAMFPQRSQQEYRFGAAGQYNWPSRIALTYKTAIPWSVALCPQKDGIDIKMYGTDTTTPVDTYLIRKEKPF